MILSEDDNIQLIEMLKYKSIFPNDITDKLICGINSRRSPNPTYRDSNHISIEYYRMQSFVKIKELHSFNNLFQIRDSIQKEFNKCVKSLVVEHNPTITKYPELSI